MLHSCSRTSPTCLPRVCFIATALDLLLLLLLRLCEFHFLAHIVLTMLRQRVQFRSTGRGDSRLRIQELTYLPRILLQEKNWKQALLLTLTDPRSGGIFFWKLALTRTPDPNQLRGLSPGGICPGGYVRESPPQDFCVLIKQDQVIYCKVIWMLEAVTSDNTFAINGHPVPQ